MKASTAIPPPTQAGRIGFTASLVVLILAAVCGAWLARSYFLLPLNQIHRNDEDFTYVYRLIDFREALDTGHWSPQWSTYAHHGLGEPYFGYYQPGFFYAASLVPDRIPPLRAIGVVVAALLAAGMFGMFRLVGERFGAAAGLTAGILFVFSNYAGTDIYVRGDNAELMAMMLLPFAAHGLLRWRATHRWPRLLLYASFWAAVVLSHAPMAMTAYLCFSLHILIEDGILHRDLKSAVLNAAPLLAGGLLASFYWLPIVLEWNLVQPAGLTQGYYAYWRHFVGARALLGPFAYGPNIVPVALGPVLLIGTVVAVTAIWRKRALLRRDQISLFLLLASSVVLSLALMVRFSAPIWRFAPLLQRLQFPWRLLASTTFGLAGIAGTALWWGNRRFALAVAVAVLAFAFYPYAYPKRIDTFALPQTPAQLAAFDYAPDGANEWLPATAKIVRPEDILPPAAVGNCRVSDFERGQSLLTASVTAAGECVVHLPHYYFPTGWTVSFEGGPAQLENKDGWMSVLLPNGGNGKLSLAFGFTPARRFGWWLSGLTMLTLGLICVFSGQQR